ncbi:BTAD domain-containing putative transcriptional regulator [Mycobacterium asiaticum]|nr:BTAD domain-containing putative transcriptional regulator [Mycobacterium asiaticum]
MELGVLGPLQVRQRGASVSIPGAKPRALLTMLGLHGGSVVSAEALAEMLWGENPPRTAAKALQTHISLLRRILGDGFVLTEGAGWVLLGSEIDAVRHRAAARKGREAVAAGDIRQAVTHFDEAVALWRAIPELPDSPRGTAEKTRWIEAHAALVEDRADALLATGRAAEIVGELEAAVAEAPLRERRWAQLMLALYRAGRQGEALGAFQRARALLADELGVDPGHNLRRLEAAIVAQDPALEIPAAQHSSAVTRTVTFLLTDIEGSTAAWEAEPDAMALALARHDELVEQVVTARGGRLIKTRGEGDATFSVFDRPSAAAAAAIELQEAIAHEPWALAEPLRIRVALHTGEVELRDGDYFGRAVNRAARLRSLAEGGQILCSGASAELVVDSLPEDVALTDLGMRQLRNLARPEHVFELRLDLDRCEETTSEAPIDRPALPSVLIGPGPFVGRGPELEHLLSAGQTAGTHAVLIAGEPGVGKTRLAGEWSQRAYEQGAIVLYGRCDEDLGAPYQPFAESLRSLVPCVGADRLRGLRGAEALLPLVPGLPDVVPDLASPARADPDTERYALFDAVVALLEIASAASQVVLVLDDLHWAAKPTLLLLRHLLRFGDRARVQVVGTYRSTDLDRSHPLAAMLADLHRDGTADRVHLNGLDADDVTAYVAEAGYDDEELAHALASVTGGNPFFLIEALRHVDESGGVWDQSTLPQGVREAVSRRLSRLSPEANTALSAAAVVGSRFELQLVEEVIGSDLIDAFDEARQAGLVLEEHGGRYRFNHAIVRQSLLAELASVRRMRLHQRIATTLEALRGAQEELLAELAHHYFECAWAGNAAKAVEYCRRAADQAMARLAYEGAADLYDRALHALGDLDDELSDRAGQATALLVARCEALLAAGDVTSATGAVAQLHQATVNSARLRAWATCFDGELSMLIHPDRLDEIEVALSTAAEELAGLDDAAGEAKAHTVRAGCLARLGRIGDCEAALDEALTAARRARDHRRVNAVLANAPLAALWGPNPVPRAGGRCLDVVRLLRITTDSPSVEATSTRCQAVLEAFRGRAPAARRMIDSARRTVTELGLRHALLEVEQFAGIVELVADNAAGAEPHLRQAYNGFRRMHLDADTAETAALLGRTCLMLDRDAEADELCVESERLAGHALKPSIAWRTLRGHLLSRCHEHDEARQVAEDAIRLAERTDLLVDHADACLGLATVLNAAGDALGARAAAAHAESLYEQKGAAVLAELARTFVGERAVTPSTMVPEPPSEVVDNACVQVAKRLALAVERADWDEFDRLFTPHVVVESRRKILRFTQSDLAASDWTDAQKRMFEHGNVRFDQKVLAVRGEHLALARLTVRTVDVSPGAPVDEFLLVYGIDEAGRLTLEVSFDLADIDAAYAELDAAHSRLGEPSPSKLKNAASGVSRRVASYFVADNWAAVAETLADDVIQDDRRKVVGSGFRQGREAVMTEISVVARAGVKSMVTDTLAVRGGRLAMNRVQSSFRDEDADAFGIDVLDVVEVDSAERVTARVVFDLEDFDAAVAELDRRYLSGEAASHARTWAVIIAGPAALNRGETPPTMTDCVSVDHRRGAAAFAPGDLIPYLSSGLAHLTYSRLYIEAVHRLTDQGAVCTHAAHGISSQGFGAEWRSVDLQIIDGDRVKHLEIFDEADLDVALATFDQVDHGVRSLTNAASMAIDRFLTHFRHRDWTAIGEMLTDDSFIDDRHDLMNSGLWAGRDAVIANLKALAEGAPTTTDVIATRGERLVLTRISSPNRDPRQGEFSVEMLIVAEVDADGRVAAQVAFNADDFGTALAELESRYLAGEAAPYADTWRVIVGSYASIGLDELPSLADDLVAVDHRRVTAFAAGEMVAYMRAGWDLDQHVRPYIETVHRLSNLGAVVSYTAQGTSHDGFEGEWRGVVVSMVDGEMVNRFELFDEADLDAALTRFDELHSRTVRLDNAASGLAERFRTCFMTRDWVAMTDLLAEDIRTDDRRHVVGAEGDRGRDVVMRHLMSGYTDPGNGRASADVGVTNMATTLIATRGNHLALSRSRMSGRDQAPAAFRTDLLHIVESNDDDRITALAIFDPDDMDAAFAELDARYLAGEAATHAHTWSLIARECTDFNRRESPAADWTMVDHRKFAIIEAADLPAAVRGIWDVTPDLVMRIEAVHHLCDLGAIVTYSALGSSPDGVDAEWHVINLLTIEAGRIDRCEIFDEADLDAALTRFDELTARQAS